jgi:TldD protein
MSVRVLADGAWGFAASEDLSRSGVEATAARAVEIARASAQVKQEDVRLAPEKPVTAEWTTPHTIDPFSISVEQNIALLLNIDSELRAVAGITLAETNLNFNREEQWFVSSEGSASIRPSIPRAQATPHMHSPETRFRNGRIPIRTADSGRTKAMS